MTLTQEQFQNWKEHPVTAHIFRTLEQWKKEAEDSLMELATSKSLDPHCSKMELVATTNRHLGKVEGLTSLLNLELDETQQEVGHE